MYWRNSRIATCADPFGGMASGRRSLETELRVNVKWENWSRSMLVVSAWFQHQLGGAGYFILCIILGLTLEPYSAIALNPRTSFAEYVATTWTHKDGLRSTFIRSIAQTSDGYIWLGTTDGLFRFDGVRFIQWHTKEQYGLGVVNALRALRDGSLLVGTEAGIVGRVRGENLVSVRSGAAVRGVLEDRDGVVWVATEDRLLKYPGAQLSSTPVVFSLPANLLSGPFQDLSGSVWVSTEEGAQRLDQSGHARILAGRMWLSQDATGAIWATREAGTSELVDAHINPGGAREKLNIHAVLRDSLGTTWIGTFGSGLYRVRPNDGKPENWTQSSGLVDDFVSSLFEDREHNLWVGTRNGLQRLHDSKVETITSRNGLASEEVLALASAPDGTVWAATAQGVNRVDHERRDLCLKGANVMAIASDPQGRLWAGTATGLVRLVNGLPEALHFSPELTHITAIAVDIRGDAWLCDSIHGLFRWSNGHADDFSQVPLLKGKSILSAEADSRGRLWLGLYGGGIVVIENGQFRAYSDRDGLPAGSVMSINADHDGKIWIGTETGLSRFDGSKFVTWTTADGLPGDRVLWVLTDHRGMLWLGYSFGIVSIKQTSLDAAARNQLIRVEFDLLDSGDGLNGNPSRNGQSSAVQASNGAIWFQLSEGIGIVDPRRLSRNPVAPPVQIEGMTADGIQIDVAGPIGLRPRTRDVEFDYTALSFVEPRRVRFRYMLEGYDAAWREADTRRQAFYTNLPPRRYRFRVVACNNDGVWNEAGAALQFDLLPAFYQTAWFKVLCLMMTVMLAFCAYRWRVWQLTASLRARFEERLAERTRIARDLHDNLLQNVLGISLQLEVTDELLAADDAARKPLQQALRLSKGAMTEGRRALNDLRAQQVASNDLVRAFAQIAQDFPARDAPVVEVLTEGQEQPLNAVAGQDVLQIGRQAIANALQHAEARRVHVLLSYSRNRLCVRVKDNGCGIDESALNLGKAGHHGISGMRERAVRIGATLSILSRAGQGTEVCLDVPGHLIYDSRRGETETS
jgi:ligand-binding sensor domain-containing protein/signal transduction histidine kinase